LDQFVVLSRNSVTFGARCIITGGDIGVTGSSNTLAGGTDSRLGVGEVLLAPRVVLGERAVTGEIGANSISAPPSAITGPRSAFEAPPATPRPGSVTPGTSDRSVGSGVTSTLAAGRYRDITVSGTLNLSGGLYELRRLQINPDGRVVAQADTTVRIQQTLSVGDRGQVNVAGALTPRNLRLLVAGNDFSDNSITFGADARSSALLVAERTVRGADRAILAGSIAARQVILGNDARLSYSGGFECATDAGCSDGNACTVDACVDAKCTHSNAPNGTVCSDGNGCTQTDTCQAGACTGSNPVACQAQDQCHDAGICDPATGTCSNPNRPDGTACSDGNACTQTDTCQAGSCGGTPVVCTPLDQCHDAGVCDSSTGLCSNPARPDGTPCTDGNACTTVDACQGGSCAGTTPVICMAQDQCHDAGVCDPMTGTCSNPTRPDGTPCSDGDSCSQVDVCQAGSCQGTDPVVCTALDQCHVAGVCNPATGGCSEPAAPNGTPCDDSEACSIGDFCSDGSCSPGTDFAVSEFGSGLSHPRSIVAGPLDSLWFVSPEATPGARNGSIARITTAGVVTRQMVGRDLGAMLHGPDDMLWIAERLIAGLPALGRFDTTARAFASDFTGINAFDLASSNDGGTPIIWFTGGSSVGRITPTGTLLSAVPTFNTTRAITAAAPAPATIIWFTEANGGGFALIGRLAFPNLQQFSITTSGQLVDIVEGPDAGIWFTIPAENEIGRMAASGGGVVRYALPSADSNPHSIVAGPDGNVWITLRGANKLARMTPEGDVMEVCIPTDASEPTQLAVGSDGNLWFTEDASGKIGRVTLSP
jgi:streptogramin lyase